MDTPYPTRNQYIEEYARRIKEMLDNANIPPEDQRNFVWAFNNHIDAAQMQGIPRNEFISAACKYVDR